MKGNHKIYLPISPPPRSDPPAPPPGPSGPGGGRGLAEEALLLALLRQRRSQVQGRVERGVQEGEVGEVGRQVKGGHQCGSGPRLPPREQAAPVVVVFRTWNNGTVEFFSLIFPKVSS